MSAPRASALDALLGARIIAPNGKSHPYPKPWNPKHLTLNTEP
jgi:hypothetical protein